MLAVAVELLGAIDLHLLQAHFDRPPGGWPAPLRIPRPGDPPAKQAAESDGADGVRMLFGGAGRLQVTPAPEGKTKARARMRTPDGGG